MTTTLENSATFKNPDVPLEQRIEELISLLTLEEKTGQLSHESPAIPRLGIPYYNWWSEVLHGHARGGKATVFPQSIGLGATFDTALMEKIATAISDETRVKHHTAVRMGYRMQCLGLTAMSPTVNLFRDPRWGRGMETYGEDPFLTGSMGAAFVKGLQGNDPQHLKVAAYAKHFAVHSGPEDGRYSFDSRVSKKDLYETYLYAFKMLVDAGVEGIMGSYNAVNGEPACASKTLLQKILRDQWHFKGNVISDGGGLHFLMAGHHAAETPEQAAAMALNNGCDLALDKIFKQGLVSAVQNGLVSEEKVDSALRRVLRTKFRLGLLDDESRNPYTSIPESVVTSKEHAQLAYDSAVKSIVLLKNNTTLPLSSDIKSIFVCGPNATNMESLLGNYYGQNARITTLLEGITDSISIGTCLSYARLCPVDGGALKKKGNKMDGGEPYECVIAAMGLSPLYEGESGGDPEDSPDDGDRMKIGLPGNQLELLQAVKDCGKKLVVVLFGGSPIEINWVMENADAVLYAFYPGEAGGKAIADILFGKAVPSGRVPFTFVRSIDDLPEFTNYDMKNRTYRYIENEPQIPFGFGLSYTKFAYDSLTLDKQSVSAGDSIIANVTVRNTGALTAEEVVQLYLTHKGASVTTPRFSLKNFKRIALQPNESKTVEFTITKEMMEIVNNDGESVLEPTEVTVTIGGCAPFACSKSLGAPEPVISNFTLAFP